VGLRDGLDAVMKLESLSDRKNLSASSLLSQQTKTEFCEKLLKQTEFFR